MSRRARFFVGFFAVLCAAFLFAGCSKNDKFKTAVKDTVLIDDPESKQLEFVDDGEVKAGDILILKDEITVGKKKYFKVKNQTTSEKGWLESNYVLDGKVSFKTVIIDASLIKDPEAKKVVNVERGRVKRGEILQLLGEKDVKGKKYFNVQILDVATNGWIDGERVKEGILKSKTVSMDSDLYVRPNLKSDKTGTIKSGQKVFVLEEKDDFALINQPWKTDAYILKNNLSEGFVASKSVSIPGLGTANVSASSQYISGEGRELAFDPRNAFDGSLQTAWSEGKTGDYGVGEYISITFAGYVHLNAISIVNGYTKDEDSYKANGRVAQLKVISDNGNEAILDLEDNVYDYQKQEVSLEGTSFKFMITKVYQGKDSDTCISEIKLEGESATPPAAEESHPEGETGGEGDGGGDEY